MPQTAALVLLVVTVLAFALVGLAHARGRIAGTEDFISARGSGGAWATGLSLLASGAGAWVLFSPAEAAARTGIVALFGYALGSALAILAFAWLGLRIRRLLPEGHALTEFVLHRFGRGMHALVLLATVAYLFVYLAAELTAIGFAVQAVTGIDRTFTVLAVLLATFAYTAYGGLRASLGTDVPQALLLALLLVALPVVLVAEAGGAAALAAPLAAESPDLVDPTSLPGWETGLALILAILGANLFNQGTWQRVWVCRDEVALRRAFIGAGLATVPLILLAGSLGLIAVAAGVLTEPSAALFDLVATWPVLGLLVLVLAVALVMSSVDTLLNALVSLFTVDVARLRPGLAASRLLALSRWLTVLPAVAAGLIALQGYSVLYLFLVADLVCLAAAMPTFWGLFARRLDQTTAILAAVAGLAAAALAFPDPTFERGSLLLSFLIAALLPLGVCALFGRRGEAFRFETLRAQIRPLGA